MAETKRSESNPAFIQNLREHPDKLDAKLLSSIVEGEAALELFFDVVRHAEERGGGRGRDISALFRTFTDSRFFSMPNVTSIGKYHSLIETVLTEIIRREASLGTAQKQLWQKILITCVKCYSADDLDRLAPLSNHPLYIFLLDQDSELQTKLVDKFFEQLHAPSIRDEARRILRAEAQRGLLLALAHKNHIGILTHIKNFGISLNELGHGEQYSALHAVSCFANKRTAVYLLNEGIDSGVCDGMGRTTLEHLFIHINWSTNQIIHGLSTENPPSLFRYLGIYFFPDEPRRLKKFFQMCIQRVIFLMDRGAELLPESSVQLEAILSSPRLADKLRLSEDNMTVNDMTCLQGMLAQKAQRLPDASRHFKVASARGHVLSAIKLSELCIAQGRKEDEDMALVWLQKAIYNSQSYTQGTWSAIGLYVKSPLLEILDLPVIIKLAHDHELHLRSHRNGVMRKFREEMLSALYTVSEHNLTGLSSESLLMLSGIVLNTDPMLGGVLVNGVLALKYACWAYFKASNTKLQTEQAEHGIHHVMTIIFSGLRPQEQIPRKSMEDLPRFSFLNLTQYRYLCLVLADFNLAATPVDKQRVQYWYDIFCIVDQRPVTTTLPTRETVQKELASVKSLLASKTKLEEKKADGGDLRQKEELCGLDGEGDIFVLPPKPGGDKVKTAEFKIPGGGSPAPATHDGSWSPKHFKDMKSIGAGAGTGVVHEWLSELSSFSLGGGGVLPPRVPVLLESLAQRIRARKGQLPLSEEERQKFIAQKELIETLSTQLLDNPDTPLHCEAARGNLETILAVCKSAELSMQVPTQ